jgi:diaminopimelate decarboxylase
MHNDVLERVAGLDGRLPALARAADLLETDPDAWRMLWSAPQMRAISYVGVPDAANPYPFHQAGLGADCGHALHLALVERLSRGAASAMMALPASAMSTRAVLRLGTPQQITQFFEPFARGEAWTFFGVTEPHAGSDAASVQTTLHRDGVHWRLSGRKILVGAAALANCGLVLALDPQTHVLRLVIIHGAANGHSFTVRKLPMSGLVGAGLSELCFDNHPIADRDILAIDSRRPVMLTLTDVFEKHRPLVGAMALGTVRGILDHLFQSGVTTGFDDLARDHSALLRRMIDLGLKADHGPLRLEDVSQFKLQACALTDRLRGRMAQLAPDLILNDPRCRRLWRDAAAFEYMEGTSNIHRLNAYRAFLTGDLVNDTAF